MAGDWVRERQLPRKTDIQKTLTFSPGRLRVIVPVRACAGQINAFDFAPRAVAEERPDMVHPWTRYIVHFDLEIADGHAEQRWDDSGGAGERGKHADLLFRPQSNALENKWSDAGCPLSTNQDALSK